MDASGDLFIADAGNNVVREVNATTGVIITLAGTGTAGCSGDNGPATAAQLSSPSGVAVDGSGDVFIADAGNNVVREVNATTGVIVTIAGTGTAGYSGDNGPATAAQLSSPAGVAVDASGDVLIADSGNNVVREVNATTGVIITIAGTGTAGYSGDNGPATGAQLSAPSSVAVDGSGDVFIADSGNNVVREVNATTGVIVTVAGNGVAGNSGDNGPATAAQLSSSSGVAVDDSGDVFIADAGNNVVRETQNVSVPSLGDLSTTAWTVNQPGLSATVPVSGGLCALRQPERQRLAGRRDGVAQRQ